MFLGSISKYQYHLHASMLNCIGLGTELSIGRSMTSCRSHVCLVGKKIMSASRPLLWVPLQVFLCEQSHAENLARIPVVQALEPLEAVQLVNPSNGRPTVAEMHLPVTPDRKQLDLLVFCMGMLLHSSCFCSPPSR